MAEAEAAEKQMERLRSERNEARTALETERKRHAEEVELLGERVEVAEVDGGGLSTVKVTWDNPALAADLANALVGVYDEVRREVFVARAEREMARRLEAQKEEVEAGD